MPMQFVRKWQKEIIVRVIADILMINFTFFTAFIARFLGLIIFGFIENVRPNLDYSILFWDFSLTSYIWSSGILTGICIIVFYVAGFYTNGRAYRSRYKTLIIIYAVSISYLIFGACSYVLKGVLPQIPRSVFLWGWVFTGLVLIAARLCSSIWTKVIVAESHIRPLRKGENIRRVLVIGGAGFIGSMLVRKLASRGYYVRILDNLFYGNKGLVGIENFSAIELMKGDCRDIEKIGFAMRGMDAVIHLAAIVGDPACALDERLTREINLASTRMIGELAKGFGVRRLIFASTCSVYGACDNLIDERSSLNPVSLYAHTKIDSEKVLLELATADFSPVVLRLATVYGLSYRPRFDLVVNLLIAKALTEKKISIFGGEQWRPFIHVDDVAESFCKCLEAKILQVHGQIFNAGSNDQNYKIRQVGEMINQRWPDTIVEFVKDLDDKRNYRVGFDKIRDVLGFIPLKTIKDAFTEFELSFSSKNVTNYRDQEYSNHKYLSSTDNIGLLRYDNSIFNNLIITKPA